MELIDEQKDQLENYSKPLWFLPFVFPEIRTVSSNVELDVKTFDFAVYLASPKSMHSNLANRLNKFDSWWLRD